MESLCDWRIKPYFRRECVEQISDWRKQHNRRLTQLWAEGHASESNILTRTIRLYVGFVLYEVLYLAIL